jgi:superfamily II DNA or RNA helicase
MFNASQSHLLEPEAFQKELINNITTALLRDNPPPCLLRAPTGSGKTFMLSRILSNVCQQHDVVWFWFVPFTTLVTQTLDALITNAHDLTPVLLSEGRNQEPSSGSVMLSTAQGVSKAAWRTKGYNADGDDDTRTIAEWVTLIRAKSLKIGLVVDEAHIALDAGTEFGKFAHWLNPDFMLMATATPKDQRLLDFLAQSGRSAYESFLVGRDEVVEAKLNKKYIEAIVYDLRQSVQSVADLKRTVLRQSWRRNKLLKKQLQEAGIALNPLLLVQVANGAGTVEEAAQDLSNLCGVSPLAIGIHTSDNPDPSMMAAIANDTSKEVLIFKQSAGTGFDAPRAFVLASTKPVNDTDFAMQFIGRAMRVDKAIRAHYSGKKQIPEGFNTAYIYLGNAEAQQGFEQAVRSTAQVKSQLEGQTEKMDVRQTVGGFTKITNKPTAQMQAVYAAQLPMNDSDDAENDKYENFLTQNSAKDKESEFGQSSLFDLTVHEDSEDFSSLAQEADVVSTVTKPIVKRIDSKEAFAALMAENGISVYPRQTTLPKLGDRLKTEEKPDIDIMSELSHSAAARLDIPSKLEADAVKVARNQLKEKEVHTELTRGSHYEQDVQIITDRNQLAKDAMQVLRALPQVEDADIKEILIVLAARMMPKIEEAIEALGLDALPDAKTMQRMARDAAHWIALQQSDKLGEAIYAAIASRAITHDAAPLPDVMLYPTDLQLKMSRKNSYGIMPPLKKEHEQLDHVLMTDARALLKDKIWQFDDATYSVGCYDGSLTLNTEELALAKALDRCNFVEWWHRNPDRKPYSVKLVRGESKNYFYPDFIVSLSHFPGDEAITRLIETKESSKDAARKARHIPAFYGKVLFLTKDNERLRWINDDGSLGDEIDLDDLDNLREWMRATRPDNIISKTSMKL